MVNKLIRKRPNRFLSGRNNYFAFGDFLFKPSDDGKVTNRSFDNMSKLGEGITKAAGIAVGQVGGGLIGGGLESGAGNVLSGLSSVASAIPGPWGAVTSAGLGLVSGLTNRIWGSKMNEQNIAQVENNINQLTSFKSNASSNDQLLSNWQNAPTGMTFTDDFIGKDGWLSNKASNKAAELRNKIAIGEDFAQRTLFNNAANISANQMQDMLANYTAFGGPLFFARGGGIHIKPENRGKFTETKRRTGKTTEELTHSKNPLTRKRAIFAQNAKKWHHAFGGDLMTHGANFDTGVTLVGNGNTHENNPYEGVPMGVDPEGTPNLVEEGEVIFNDYVFSNRLKVPKAVRNKYKLRGNKSLTFADAALQMSKESEERPNDPISQNGLQALLGELAYAQEGIREKRQARKTYAYGGELGNIFAGEGDNPNILTYPGGSAAIANANTYGDWANFRFGDTLLYDPSTRRYNNMYVSDDFMNWAKTDPAALEFAQTWWGNKENAQNYFSRNRTAPTYEDLFVGTNGRKALMYDAPFGNTQAYSDAHRYGQALFEQYMNRKQRGKGERRYLTGLKDEAGTPLPDTLITDWDPSLYEYVRTGSGFDADTDYTDYYYRKKATPTNRKVRFRDSKDGEWTTYDSLDAAMDAGIDLSEFGTPAEGEEFNSYTKLAPGKEMPSFDNWMRYAPIAGSLTGLGMSLFSKPDESGAEAILEASRGAGAYQPIRFKPVGNYLTYNPFDTEFVANRANAEAAAARRAIMNTAGGNRAQAMAGILAADNNALNQLGVLRRGAAEDNLKQRQMVEDFNRATNMFNSEGFFKADAANQQALAQARDFSLRGTMAAEEIRQRARLAKDNAIQANLSGLFTSLGNIGQERVARQQMKWMIDNGFAPGYGTEKKAKGGKIKRRKKGLTY